MQNLKVKTVKVKDETWNRLNTLRKRAGLTWEGLFLVFLKDIKVK